MKENNRVLIIDDDEGIRETYQGIFTPEQQSDVVSKGMALFGQPERGSTLAEKSEQAVSKKNYELSQAENGRKGIEKVTAAKKNNTPFAVAFIDMKMPGLDGAQTSKKIWEIDPGIKIVIVTAYSEHSPEDIIKVTGRDNIFYLRKPFNHEEILQFARALTNEWNLERKLARANEQLKDMNKNLKEKVEKQAAMIVQSEKMASIGLLAAGVAHEINNPIAFVNSNLSVVKKYFSKITAVYRKYGDMEAEFQKIDNVRAVALINEMEGFKKENQIEMIMGDLDDLANESIDGIQRIRAIVKDLKTFSRIDESEYKPIDINHAIDTTLNMVNNEIKYKAVVEKEYGDIPQVKCYPQKISQVFMNILINSSQAIEKNGSIKISTELITEGRRENDKFVKIIISDTGCGIPQKNLGKLFDPFFTTKPVGTGTGLGLSIVYEIIRAHEGNINVKSNPEKGTQFIIQLPVSGLKVKSDTRRI